MDAQPAAPRQPALERIWIAAAAMLVVINVWTGAPLLAVWVGAKIQGGSGSHMSSVFIVIGILAVLELGLGWALTWLNDRYDRVMGRATRMRRTSPWLRSMSGESEQTMREGGRNGMTAIERIVVVGVAAAFLAFEGWFFFLAGSPI